MMISIPIWPLTWWRLGSSEIARSWAAITPTTWPVITASTLSTASSDGWKDSQ